MTGQDTSRQVLHPRHWKPARGYANGVVAEGRTIFVAGQIGWNADQKFESQDFVAQIRQALENVVAVVREAGGRPEHITRLTWFITDKKAYLASIRSVGEIYRAVMGKNFPTMSVVQVAALIEDEALIEIEATAVVPD